SLKQSAIPAEAFYPQQNLYQKLKARGVVSYIFQHQAYTPSTYSRAILQGAQLVPYHNLTDALTRLTNTVLAHKAPPYYYFVYYDRIDTLCHLYWPYSPQF